MRGPLLIRIILKLGGTAVYTGLLTVSFWISDLLWCQPLWCVIWGLANTYKGCHCVDIYEGWGIFPALNAGLDLWSK